MPALQRRQNSPNLRRAKASVETEIHTMVKSSSPGPSDDGMDVLLPKQLAHNAPQLKKLPVRYESDEESISPCPDDFEDARSFFEIEFDPSIDLEADDVPSISEAREMSIVKAPTKPILVNISKIAPMEKRSTQAHVRPGSQNKTSTTMKTSIGRPIPMRTASKSSGTFQPPVPTLSRPPARFRAPPPVPPRSGARVDSPSTPTVPWHMSQQNSSHPARKSSHTPRQSISTVGTRASMDDTDDGRSSVAGDSMSSSAPTSVADEADLSDRYADMSGSVKSVEDEKQKCSTPLHEQHDAELERAINDYMMWRSEGSPGEPPETVYNLSQEDKQMVRDHEEEEWRREIEMGLTTPTPTSYSAYDPYGVSPPSLVRPKAPFQGHKQENNDIHRLKGLRKGLGMVKRTA